MNFIFECSTRYLTSERSEGVRCRVEHQKIKFISTSGHVIFCLLHKHTNDDVFEDFPKISNQFPKISEDFPNFSEGKANVSENFSDSFRILPKISEKAPMMFRSYSNISKYVLRDYSTLYNNQMNARALIGQSAVGYCAGKPTEKSRVF